MRILNLRSFYLASTFPRLVNRSLKRFFLSLYDSCVAIDYETGRHFGTAQPGSLGYLRPRHGRDLISSAACSSRAIFVHSSRHRNVRVCNRLRNGWQRVLLYRFTDFCMCARTRTTTSFFARSDRPSQWAICSNAIHGEFAKSLPQNSPEYSLWSWLKRLIFWARTQREMRTSSRLVPRLNARNMFRQ